jgi:gluconolactonase
MPKVQQHDIHLVGRSGGDAALSRRTLIKAMGAGAGALAVGSAAARAQEAMGPVAPPTTVSSPPRDFGPGGAPTTYFRDPDVIAVDPAFDGITQPNASI